MQQDPRLQGGFLPIICRSEAPAAFVTAEWRGYAAARQARQGCESFAADPFQTATKCLNNRLYICTLWAVLFRLVLQQWGYACTAMAQCQRWITRLALAAYAYLHQGVL